jgi:hypothetical protein
MVASSDLNKSIAIINNKARKNENINEKDNQLLRKLIKWLKNTTHVSKSISGLHELIENIIFARINLTIAAQFKALSVICSHKAYRHHLNGIASKNNALLKYIQRRAKNCQLSQFLLQYCEKSEIEISDSVESHYLDFQKEVSVDDISFLTNEIPTVLYDYELIQSHLRLNNALYFSDMNKQTSLFYLSKSCQIANENRCRPITLFDFEAADNIENLSPAV